MIPVTKKLLPVGAQLPILIRVEADGSLRNPLARLAATGCLGGIDDRKNLSPTHLKSLTLLVGFNFVRRGSSETE